MRCWVLSFLSTIFRFLNTFLILKIIQEFDSLVNVLICFSFYLQENLQLKLVFF